VVADQGEIQPAEERARRDRVVERLGRGGAGQQDLAVGQDHHGVGACGVGRDDVGVDGAEEGGDESVALGAADAEALVERSVGVQPGQGEAAAGFRRAARRPGQQDLAPGEHGHVVGEVVEVEEVERRAAADSERRVEVGRGGHEDAPLE
jgi:hypothetical protein